MNYGTEEEKENARQKFQIGVFQDLTKSGFFEEYEKLVDRLVTKDDAASAKKEESK